MLHNGKKTISVNEHFLDNKKKENPKKHKKPKEKAYMQLFYCKTKIRQKGRSTFDIVLATLNAKDIK